MSILQIKEELNDTDVINKEKNMFVFNHSDFPDSVKRSIEISRKEIAEGKGIPHEEVMKMAEEWLKK